MDHVSIVVDFVNIVSIVNDYTDANDNTDRQIKQISLRNNFYLFTESPGRVFSSKKGLIIS